MSFLRRVSGLSLRDRVRSSDIQEELRVEPLLLHVQRSQLRWFNIWLGWRRPRGGPTQDTLEGLHLWVVLGTPRDPPGGAGGSGRGERGLSGLPAEAVAPETRRKRKKTTTTTTAKRDLNDKNCKI